LSSNRVELDLKKAKLKNSYSNFCNLISMYGDEQTGFRFTGIFKSRKLRVLITLA
jgi:hypothetical protein